MLQYELHDWSLLSVCHDWETGAATVRLRGPTEEKSLIGRGVIELSLAQLERWGRSVSINRVIGPDVGSDNISTVQIEMESGDLITLRARSIATQ